MRKREEPSSGRKTAPPFRKRTEELKNEGTKA